jgi:hypothetical protein
MAYNREAYLRNRESCLASQRRWREKNLERDKSNKRRWREANKDRRRDVHLRSRYGLSLVEYQDLFQKQNGKCAICLKKPRMVLGVDHNHSTGKVRGLLCQLCNGYIGHIKEQKDSLKRAIRYLS